MPFFFQKYSKYLILLLVALVAVSNLIFSITYNLHPDEAYYWAWSRQLDIGYFDNSPFVAYVIRFFTMIGGQNELWVRMPAFLGWLAFLFFVFQMAKKIYNKNAAWLGVLIALFVPLVTSGSHIMTHDIPMIFFASLTWYFLYYAIEKGKKEAWYWVGLFFGLALFSKFQAILIGLAVFLMLLVRPSKRNILLTKEPYIAAVIGFIMFLPVLYWNWQHHWAAFLWQSQHGIHQQISLNKELEFFAGQLGVFSPLLFLSFIYYTVKKLIKRDTPAEVSFLIGCFLPVFLFFCFTSLTFPASPNWPAVGYLPAIIFLAGELGNSFHNLVAIKRRLLIVYIGLAFGISILLLSLIRYPEFFVNKLNWQMSPDLILTNGTYGWAQLGRKIDGIIEEDFPNGKRPVPVFGDSYQVAAELQFYISKPAIVFTSREAHRNHFDYITIKKIRDFNNRPGLLVLEKKLPAGSANYFSDITPVETMIIERFNHQIRKFNIYRFKALNAEKLYDMAVNKPLGYPGTYQD